jgi:hypothetical protein
MQQRWPIVLGIMLVAVLAHAQDVTGETLVSLNAARDATGVPPTVQVR